MKPSLTYGDFHGFPSLPCSPEGSDPFFQRRPCESCLLCCWLMLVVLTGIASEVSQWKEIGLCIDNFPMEYIYIHTLIYIYVYINIIHVSSLHISMRFATLPTLVHVVAPFGFASEINGWSASPTAETTSFFGFVWSMRYSQISMFSIVFSIKTTILGYTVLAR